MKKAGRNSESVTSARWISFDRKEESGERNTDTKKESTRLTTCKLQGEGERKREKVACTLLGGSYIAGTACCKTQCATFCGGLRCLSAISRQPTRIQAKFALRIQIGSRHFSFVREKFVRCFSFNRRIIKRRGQFSRRFRYVCFLCRGRNIFVFKEVEEFLRKHNL